MKPPAQRSSWTADNGNGTYTNPIFFEEFSDPDVIQVGDDYFMAGTSMHVMPGIPVLHSRDLVNWTLASYVYDRIDLSPGFRLEEGREIYGQGTWAPTLRHHNGVFYVLTNVNGHRTQVFRTTDPFGKWQHNELNVSFHDLSILFDGDKVYAIHGHQEIHMVELNAALTEVVPDSGRVIIQEGSGMGEGVHFYKFHGKYYILSAVWDPVCYMVCARAERPDGPYEITTISAEESFGISMGWRLVGNGRQSPPFDQLVPPHPTRLSRIPLHQGGIVETRSGEWWALAMMDYNGVGRVTALSPITWRDGWPYFGLPGNLGRSPRTWRKPDTGVVSEPRALFDRNDDFSGPALNPVWQWNHHPDDSKWSLSENPGHLRLHSLPAPDFWWARNSLTQRAVGPESIATAEVDLTGMLTADTAGLALLGFPHAWVGIVRTPEGFMLRHFDQSDGSTTELPFAGNRVWLRVHGDFDNDLANFLFSTDGVTFESIGTPFRMIWQAKTFQGMRYALFHYNTGGGAGGHVDVARFTLEEPRPRGLPRPIPAGETVTFTSLADGSLLAVRNGVLESVAADSPVANSPAARFRIVDCGLGRVALFNEAYQAFLGSTTLGLSGDVRIRRGLATPGESEMFQWIDQLRGDLTLLSLATHRYIKSAPEDVGPVSAHHPGPCPTRRDGSCFLWEISTPVHS